MRTTIDFKNIALGSGGPGYSSTLYVDNTPIRKDHTGDNFIINTKDYSTGVHTVKGRIKWWRWTGNFSDSLRNYRWSETKQFYLTGSLGPKSTNDTSKPKTYAKGTRAKRKGRRKIAAAKLRWKVKDNTGTVYVKLKIQKRVKSRSRTAKKARYLRAYRKYRGKYLIYKKKYRKIRNRTLSRRYQRAAVKYKKAMNKYHRAYRKSIYAILNVIHICYHKYVFAHPA